MAWGNLRRPVADWTFSIFPYIMASSTGCGWFRLVSKLFGGGSADGKPDEKANCLHVGFVMSDIVVPDLVSDFLIVEMRNAGDSVSNLKLQKLLYYAQAWFLALHDKEIFAEDFQAWVHGPVLPSQYHRFKHFGWEPIADRIRAPLGMPPLLQRHLREIIEVFGTETAVALELMTHREAPWLEARRGLPMHAHSQSKISKTLMRRYYKQMSATG